jgi:hypothetical protein
MVKLEEVAENMTIKQVDCILGRSVVLTHEEEVSFKENLNTNNYSKGVSKDDTLRGYQCQEYPHQIFAVFQFRDGRLCSNPHNGFSCFQRKSKIKIDGNPFVLAADNNPGGWRQNNDFIWNMLIKNDQTGLLFCHGKIQPFRLNDRNWKELMLVIESNDVLVLKKSYGARVVDGGSKFVSFAKGATTKDVEICFLTPKDKATYEKDLLLFKRIWDVLQAQVRSTISGGWCEAE